MRKKKVFKIIMEINPTSSSDSIQEQPPEASHTTTMTEGRQVATLEEQNAPEPRDRRKLKAKLRLQIKQETLDRDSEQKRKAQYLATQKIFYSSQTQSNSLLERNPPKDKPIRDFASYEAKLLQKYQIPFPHKQDLRAQIASKVRLAEKIANNTKEKQHYLTLLIATPQLVMANQFVYMRDILENLTQNDITKILEKAHEAIKNLWDEKDQRLIIIKWGVFLCHLNLKQLTEFSETIFRLAQFRHPLSIPLEILIVAIFRSKRSPSDILSHSRFQDLQPNRLFESSLIRERLNREEGQILFDLLKMIQSIEFYDDIIQKYGEPEFHNQTLSFCLPWFDGDAEHWILETLPKLIQYGLRNENPNIAQKAVRALQEYIQDCFLLSKLLFEKTTLLCTKMTIMLSNLYNESVQNQDADIHPFALAIRHNIPDFLKLSKSPYFFDQLWNIMKNEGLLKADYGSGVSSFKAFKEMLSALNPTNWSPDNLLLLFLQKQYPSKENEGSSFSEKMRKLFFEAVGLEKFTLAAACFSETPEILSPEEQVDFLDTALKQEAHELVLELIQEGPLQNLEVGRWMDTIIKSNRVTNKQKQALLLKLFSVCFKSHINLPNPSEYHKELEALKTGFATLLQKFYDKQQKASLTPEEEKAQKEAQRQQELARSEAALAQLKANFEDQERAQQKQTQLAQKNAQQIERQRARETRAAQRRNRHEQSILQSHSPSSADLEMKESGPVGSVSSRDKQLLDWVEQAPPGEARGLLKWNGVLYKVKLDLHKLEETEYEQAFIRTFQETVQFEFQASSGQLSRVRSIQGNPSQGIKYEGKIVCRKNEPIVNKGDVIRKLKLRSDEVLREAFAIKLNTTHLRVVGIILPHQEISFCTEPIGMAH